MRTSIQFILGYSRLLRMFSIAAIIACGISQLENAWAEKPGQKKAQKELQTQVPTKLSTASKRGAPLESSSASKPSAGIPAGSLGIAPIAIYVVDLGRVLAESTVGQAAQSRVEKEMESRRAELQEAGKNLKKEAEALEQQKALLSEEAIQEKKKNIESKQKELSRRARDHEEAIAALEQKELKTFGDVVKKAVERVARAAKAQVVLPKNPQLVVYASSKFDLTAAVIKEVNQG